MAARFSKCPTWWVNNNKLGIKKFGGGAKTGESISALKCVLAISLSIDFHTRKAKLSISDLEKLTGLSRPMVIRGLKSLEGLGIIDIDKTEHTYQYELTVSEGNENWGKIPYERVRARLPEIGNRGIVTLTALKIYILLIWARPNESLSVSMGYDKLLNYLGCQRCHLRPALDILYSHMLIGIKKEGLDAKALHNVYTILGL